MQLKHDDIIFNGAEQRELKKAVAAKRALNSDRTRQYWLDVAVGFKLCRDGAVRLTGQNKGGKFSAECGRLLEREKLDGFHPNERTDAIWMLEHHGEWAAWLHRIEDTTEKGARKRRVLNNPCRIRSLYEASLKPKNKKTAEDLSPFEAVAITDPEKHKKIEAEAEERLGHQPPMTAEEKADFQDSITIEHALRDMAGDNLEKFAVLLLQALGWDRVQQLALLLKTLQPLGDVFSDRPRRSTM